MKKFCIKIILKRHQNNKVQSVKKNKMQLYFANYIITYEMLKVEIILFYISIKMQFF